MVRIIIHSVILFIDRVDITTGNSNLVIIKFPVKANKPGSLLEALLKFKVQQCAMDVYCITVCMGVCNCSLLLQPWCAYIFHYIITIDRRRYHPCWNKHPIYLGVI